MSCLSECVALREYGYGFAHRAAMKRSYRVERRTSRVRIPVWPTWGLSTSISGGEVAKGAMLETELFALLEQTADAAYTVTEGGEICSWNGAAERLFGYTASEVLHRTSTRCSRRATRWAPARSRGARKRRPVTGTERPAGSPISTWRSAPGLGAGSG